MGLEERITRIDAKRSALLDRVDALDQELVRARVHPGKWSIQEVIEHLVLAEEDVLIDPTCLDQLPARPRRLKDRVLYAVVMFILRYGIPVKAPSSGMLPSGQLSLGQLRERWEANHSRLRHYVQGLQGDASRRVPFHHPVAGPLTVVGALRMLEAHLDRHARQIETLARSRA